MSQDIVKTVDKSGWVKNVPGLGPLKWLHNVVMHNGRVVSEYYKAYDKNGKLAMLGDPKPTNPAKHPAVPVKQNHDGSVVQLDKPNGNIKLNNGAPVLLRRANEIGYRVFASALGQSNAVHTA